ncbi:MAG: hypothetical protein AAF531_08640 [Actinomycetota bacterium]
MHWIPERFEERSATLRCDSEDDPERRPSEFVRSIDGDALRIGEHGESLLDGVLRQQRHPQSLGVPSQVAASAMNDIRRIDRRHRTHCIETHNSR